MKMRCHFFQICNVPFLPGAFFSWCHSFRCHFFRCHLFPTPIPSSGRVKNEPHRNMLAVRFRWQRAIIMAVVIMIVMLVMMTLMIMVICFFFAFLLWFALLFYLILLLLFLDETCCCFWVLFITPRSI